MEKILVVVLTNVRCNQLRRRIIVNGCVSLDPSPRCLTNRIPRASVLFLCDDLPVFLFGLQVVEGEDETNSTGHLPEPSARSTSRPPVFIQLRNLCNCIHLDQSLITWSSRIYLNETTDRSEAAIVSQDSWPSSCHRVFFRCQFTRCCGSRALPSSPSPLVTPEK
jgi:hypothetical protein